ncbi:hypothetical protein JTB14_000194 [Gonioctena quinquepunctata]|nr:hypothetical protein JTB14_000194 [Gonioctena quinquepunctata]
MSTTEVRRSKRAIKGIPPSKYTEGSRHEEKERSKVPSKSKKTNASSLRRKKLQAELEAEKQLAEISRQELEIQKKLIQKELEVRQAELEESQDLGSSESRESLLLIEELNLGGNETELLNMDLEKIRIQQWINNIPSVNTFADKSISLSSRSGKAESFEVVKEVPEEEGMYSVKMPKIDQSNSVVTENFTYQEKNIRPSHEKLPSELLPEEIHMAENVWIKNIQENDLQKKLKI